MSNILSLATSTLYLPTVLLVAIICLLILVRHTLSSSIKSSVPTPLLANASTVYPPTPPIPNTATLAFLRYSIFSFPNNNSVLENWFNIYSSMALIISCSHERTVSSYPWHTTSLYPQL